LAAGSCDGNVEADMTGVCEGSFGGSSPDLETVSEFNEDRPCFGLIPRSRRDGNAS
jgi:hypothetical protein